MCVRGRPSFLIGAVNGVEIKLDCSFNGHCVLRCGADSSDSRHQNVSSQDLLRAKHLQPRETNHSSMRADNYRFQSKLFFFLCEVNRSSYTIAGKRLCVLFKAYNLDEERGGCPTSTLKIDLKRKFLTNTDCSDKTHRVRTEV